jgi:hypothetical protein
MLLSQSKRYLKVEWMGQRFNVKKSDVVDLRDATVAVTSRSGGAAVTLSLSAEADLLIIRRVRPANVLATLPFALRERSAAIVSTGEHTEAERIWLEARGLLNPVQPTASATTSYRDTTSAQVTATKTVTDAGDSKVDDTPSDGMGTDDSEAYDVNNDDPSEDDDDEEEDRG